MCVCPTHFPHYFITIPTHSPCHPFYIYMAYASVHAFFADLPCYGVWVQRSNGASLPTFGSRLNTFTGGGLLPARMLVHAAWCCWRSTQRGCAYLSQHIYPSRRAPRFCRAPRERCAWRGICCAAWQSSTGTMAACLPPTFWRIPLALARARVSLVLTCLRASPAFFPLSPLCAP